MMQNTPYIHPDILLESDTARKLYHEHAENLPIIDFHSHLNPMRIIQDHQYRSITELWFCPGEYKWRALRANGISERYITGDASDWEKFKTWAETMPKLYRNPLYIWTHTELKRLFGIDETLNPENARNIFDHCNELLRKPEFSFRQILNKFNVEVICTANDITDSLSYHSLWKRKNDDSRLLPTWKPDRLFEIDDLKRYNRYIDELGDSAEVVIRTYGSLLEALRKRHAYFHSKGCRMSDLSMETFYVEDYTSLDIDEIFSKIVREKSITEKEANKLRAALLVDLCEMDYKTGWAQQYHIGVQTDINTTMYKLLGRHSGFDGMNDRLLGLSLSKFLDKTFQRGIQCRTMIHNLNPRDFDMLAVILGCFQDGSYPGKLQLGAAWWYLNNEVGIFRQINSFSNHGLLGNFVGMATDSHSPTSYCRHEYFRRILCNIIGADLESGRLPFSEYDNIAKMIENISYYNAKKYFNL